jgi:lipopolysaccharide export system ATP-binding protein
VSEGYIIASGNAAAILANEKVRHVYLGDDFKL